MKNTKCLWCVLCLGCLVGCSVPADDFRPETIINLEKGALDRWGKGDPDGYVEIMAPGVTYFDPQTKTRVDGRDQAKTTIDIVRGNLQIDSYEFLNPTVIRSGDMAVLSTNLVSKGASFKGSPKRDARWNVTEVYQRIDGKWKIVHSHFSYTTPQLAQAATP